MSCEIHFSFLLLRDGSLLVTDTPTTLISVFTRHAPNPVFSRESRVRYSRARCSRFRYSRARCSRFRSFPGFGHSRGSVIPGVRSFPGFGHSRGSVIPGYLNAQLTREPFQLSNRFLDETYWVLGYRLC